ncbi:hypothetical protein AAF712_007319 [Marasmius tenuissimus]|uniref:ABM domain-containing protein n=1 Tax=Marasmius tenuissimus TaxID=585030 RepID=A0ABR2ZW99_9AGAR
MSIVPPPELKSKFIVIAHVIAVEGKADEVQKHLSVLRQDAESSKEPGTLTYRTTRGVGNESNKFTVIEEYADKEAMGQHAKSEVSTCCISLVSGTEESYPRRTFKAFVAAGIVVDLSVTFREEFH